MEKSSDFAPDASADDSAEHGAKDGAEHGAVYGARTSAEPHRRGRKAGQSVKNHPYMVVGYQPVSGVPREDYADFFKAKIRLDELRYGLQYGNFPPGLILQREGDGAMLVWGGYGEKQRLRPLMEEIRIG